MQKTHGWNSRKSFFCYVFKNLTIYRIHLEKEDCEKRERDIKGMRKKVTIMEDENERIENETVGWNENENEKNNERENYNGQR